MQVRAMHTALPHRTANQSPRRARAMRDDPPKTHENKTLHHSTCLRPISLNMMKTFDFLCKSARPLWPEPSKFLTFLSSFGRRIYLSLNLPPVRPSSLLVCSFWRSPRPKTLLKILIEALATWGTGRGGPGRQI